MMGGVNFRRRSCQGCKKSARIKLSDNNTYGDKTLSIVRTNCIAKAFKGEKITEMTKRAAAIVVAVAAAV